jgi:hypothetical protein
MKGYKSTAVSYNMQMQIHSEGKTYNQNRISNPKDLCTS